MLQLRAALRKISRIRAEIAGMLRDGVDIYVHRVGVEGRCLAMEIGVREFAAGAAGMIRGAVHPLRQRPCSIPVLGDKEEFQQTRVRSVTEDGEGAPAT